MLQSHNTTETTIKPLSQCDISGLYWTNFLVYSAQTQQLTQAKRAEPINGIFLNLVKVTKMVVT